MSSRICLKVDSDYPRGICENVVYHFHGTIQIIVTSYLRPVWGVSVTDGLTDKQAFVILESLKEYFVPHNQPQCHLSYLLLHPGDS